MGGCSGWGWGWSSWGWVGCARCCRLDRVMLVVWRVLDMGGCCWLVGWVGLLGWVAILVGAGFGWLFGWGGFGGLVD